jgi:hypothetical protein
MAQENLKKAFHVVFDLVKQGEKSFADGVQAKDAFDFIPAVMTASAIDWKAAIAEAKQRDEASNAELLEFIKQDFDLVDDVAEAKVEALVAFVLAADTAYLAFKPVEAPAPEPAPVPEPTPLVARRS